MAGALKFVDDDILYEDFNFQTPFKGIGAVKKLFEESCDGIPDDMLFIVDECTDGGGISAGPHSISCRKHPNFEPFVPEPTKGIPLHNSKDARAKLKLS